MDARKRQGKKREEMERKSGEKLRGGKARLMREKNKKKGDKTVPDCV